MTENEVVDAWKNVENKTNKKIITTKEKIFEMILENQLTEIGYLKIIKNYLGFFAILIILGLILSFCTAVL